MGYQMFSHSKTGCRWVLEGLWERLKTEEERGVVIPVGVTKDVDSNANIIPGRESKKRISPF